MKTVEERTNRLMPNGVPRYVRCYDDGREGDRYTIIFTNIGKRLPEHRFGTLYLTMYENGSFYYGESRERIDSPTYSHLGKRIRFEDLPAVCQRVVANEYRDIWGIKE